jgi:uncharacterized membrane protein
MARIQHHPRVKMKMNFMEHLLEIISISGLFTAGYFLIQYWPELPATIPSHFDFNGEVDAWSNKSSLYMLLGMNVFLYLLMTIIRRFPHTFNYPVKITEKNAKKQYQLATLYLAVLKAELVWLFVYLQWQIIQVALGSNSALGPWFLTVVILSLTVPLIVYIIIARKNRDFGEVTKKRR